MQLLIAILISFWVILKLHPVTILYNFLSVCDQVQFVNTMIYESIYPHATFMCYFYQLSNFSSNLTNLFESEVSSRGSPEFTPIIGVCVI